MKLFRAAALSATMLATLAISPVANAASDGDTVYMYCMGNPPVNVRSSFMYISDVFTHTLDVYDNSPRDEAADFIDEVYYQYDDAIGATCHYYDTWDDAEYERDATIRHRRNNGYDIEYVDY